MNGLRGMGTQPEDVMSNLIAYLVLTDKESVIGLLRKNGLGVSKKSSDDEIILAVYAAFQKSAAFRRDLYDLAQSSMGEMSYVGDDFFNSGFSGDENFFNADAKSKKLSYAQGGQGTAVGNLLRSVFTPERKEQLLNTGFDVLTKKLTQKGDTAQAQQLIQLEAAKAQASLAEAQAAQSKAEGKKWVLPVVIGSVVIIGGIIAYLVMRKK